MGGRERRVGDIWEGEMEKSKRHTRSVGPVYDLDIVFEKTKMYSPVTKLPTYGGVVGMLR